MQEVAALHIATGGYSNIHGHCRIALRKNLELILSTAGPSLHALLLSPASLHPKFYRVPLPPESTSIHLQYVVCWLSRPKRENGEPGDHLYVALASMYRTSNSRDPPTPSGPQFTLRIWEADINVVTDVGLALTAPTARIVMEQQLSFAPLCLNALPDSNGKYYLVVPGADGEIHVYTQSADQDNWGEVPVPWPEWQNISLKYSHDLFLLFMQHF